MSDRSAPLLVVSVLVGQHDGDDRLAIVAGAADRFQAGERGRAVLPIIVADVDGEADLRTAAAAADRTGEQPDDIPEPAGFVLVEHAGRDGYTAFPRGACQGDGEPDSGFSCRVAHVGQNAVAEGGGAGMPIDRVSVVEHGCSVVVERFPAERGASGAAPFRRVAWGGQAAKSAEAPATSAKSMTRVNRAGGMSRIEYQSWRRLRRNQA